MKTPLPFVYDINHVKAIVLGADPSNFSEHGKTKELTHAFGIGSGDSRYFLGILANLEAINLSIKDVYVQNLIPEYLPEETSKYKDWEKIAEIHLPQLIKDLDAFDKKRRIPVLVTAERVMKFLTERKLPKPKDIYQMKSEDLVFRDNKLRRVVIPFYRHPDYGLNKADNEGFRDRLIKVFDTI
jgi:hypothetical protein